MLFAMSGSKSKLLKPFGPSDERPELLRSDDGSASLMFEMMPPCDKDGEPIPFERVENLDSFLAAELRTEVIWEDRESFFLPQGESVTIEAIQAALSKFEAEFLRSH